MNLFNSNMTERLEMVSTVSNLKTMRQTKKILINKKDPLIIKLQADRASTLLIETTQ